MSHVKPDTFATIAGQILNAEFTAYTATKPGYDILAMIDEEVWLGGNALLEYATFNETHHMVTIRCEGVTYDHDVTDTDTLSRTLVSACNRIETILADIISV